jgi:hypothetical protein
VIRLLLLVEGVSFLLASLIHAGLLVSGYEHSQARIAESILGGALILGWLWTLVRPASLRLVALAVQTFALLGTLVGGFTILVGVGPRSTPDIVYHVVIIVVLLAGLRVAAKVGQERSLH